MEAQGDKSPAVHKLVFRNHLLNYVAFHVSSNTHLMFVKSFSSEVPCLL